MKLCTCLGSVLALISASVFAEPSTVIRDNGPASNRIDIVVLGDGYTAGELDTYAADVDQMMQQFFLEAPFDEYETYFNVRRVDVTSNESGVDHPEIDEYKDTALGAYYFCASIQRLICVDYSAVSAVLDASVNFDERDIVLVIVNDDEYGGSGGAFAVTSTHAASLDVALHEIGHSFGQLADEYESSPPACNTSFEPAAANITMETDRNLIKWNVGGGPPTGWIDPATPVPHESESPTDVVGLYDGGGYCVAGEGMYRPTFNSKMRSLGIPFGPINGEQLIRRMYAFAYPVDSQTPLSTVQTLQFGDSFEYSVTPLQPATHALETFWYLDLNLVANGGDSLSLTPDELTPGPHQVFVWVHDATEMVRSDPSALLWGYGIWTVYIASDGDRDGDGVPDESDAFPDDPTEQADFDGDLIGDNADTDDDNDMVADDVDVFPFDPTEWLDTDGDGIGDNADEVPDSQTVLFAIDLAGPYLSLLRKSDAFELAFIQLFVPGVAQVGNTGLAVSPVTHEMYVAVVLEGQSRQEKYLLQINPNSGNVVVIGNTGLPISGLSFDNQGILYGITGDCNVCDPVILTESLFTIDLNTAQASLVQELGNGDDGEAIAFNSDDGLMYHLSGRGQNMVFETVDLTNGTVTDIPLSGDSIGDSEAWGIVYDPLDQRFVGSIWDKTLLVDQYIAISTTGVVTIITEQPFSWNDFAFWNLLRAGLTDIDNDGFPDFADEFPTDGGEWTDFDGDGVGNNSDVFPKDPSESADSDGDGVGDNADDFPNDPNETTDTDGDGCGDNGDAFPNDNTECLDTDGDGIGNNADPDDDNDGVPDAQDDYPLGRFDDVLSDYWAFSFVEALARAGITGGCRSEMDPAGFVTQFYCPEDSVTRAQMAVFLERGINGSDFAPPAASGTLFLDVGTNDFAAAFIEQLFLDGITGGCGNNNYCPNDAVTRAQMAVFLLRAKYGSAYTPPPATGVAFGDVNAGYWAVAWVEQLAAEGITGGCGNGNYCPENPVTRAQMAVFLVRAFGL